MISKLHFYHSHFLTTLQYKHSNTRPTLWLIDCPPLLTFFCSVYKTLIDDTSKPFFLVVSLTTNIGASLEHPHQKRKSIFYLYPNNIVASWTKLFHRIVNPDKHVTNLHISTICFPNICYHQAPNKLLHIAS